jgi:hypothetical protein
VADIDGVAGIDAHKHTFTVAVLDGRGGRCGIESFPTSSDGLAEVLALLDSFGFAIGRIGVEGSAGLSRHVAAFLVAAGYDVREVEPIGPLSGGGGGTRPTGRTPRRSRGRHWLTPACRQPASSAGRSMLGGAGRGP